jgi:L-arabinose transport system substrate-binding protein
MRQIDQIGKSSRREGTIRNLKMMITAAAIAVSAAAVAHAAGVKIGFVVKQPEEARFQDEWKLAVMAAKQKAFELVKIGAVDSEKVQAVIDDLTAHGAEGLIIFTPTSA